MLILFDVLSLVFSEIPDEEEPDEEEVSEDEEDDAEADDDSEEDAEEDSEDEPDEEDDSKEDVEADTDTDDREMVPMEDLRKLRRENKKRRLELREAEKKLEAQKKAAAEKEKKAKRAKMDEQDRLQAELEDERQENERLAAQLEEREARLKNAKRNNAIIATASRLGFEDPDDAVAMLRDQIDTFDVGSEGEVDPDDIGDALAELLDRKPYLAKRAEDKPTRRESAKVTNQSSGTKVRRQRPNKSDNDDEEDETTNREKRRELLRQGQGAEAIKLRRRLYLKKRKAHTGPDEFGMP
jgi:hypothetical protein